MNQELEKVTLWLAANKLSLKVGKANFMIFKSKNKKRFNISSCNYCRPKYKISRSHKILRGLHRRKILLEISYQLYVSMKVSKITGIIEKIKARNYLELKNLKELYNTMVYP